MVGGGRGGEGGRQEGGGVGGGVYSCHAWPQSSDKGGEKWGGRETTKRKREGCRSLRAAFSFHFLFFMF